VAVSGRAGETRRMAARMDQPSTSARLRCGIVLGVQEDACEIVGEGGRRSVRYATAGAGVDMAKDADVELDEVERFCTEHDLWNRLVMRIGS